MTRAELLKIAKPILFNTEMVKGILERRKTVTRRICKDANDYTVPDMSFYDADKRTYAVHNYADAEHTDKLSIAERKCPICPGDILYVRETWCMRYDGEKYFYKADKNTQREEKTLIDYTHVSWKPSIHMPKEAARIFLKVTDVRAERLKDMNLDDFLNEGIMIRPEAFNDPENAYWQAKDAFIYLWNSTIKKTDIEQLGWDANPWVWVIEFERIEPDSEV